MVDSVGTVSGALLNPAVSLAISINKRMSANGLFTYIGAQLIGALADSATLRFFLSQLGIDSTDLGATTLIESLSILGGSIIEVFLTFLFVLVILPATGRNGDPHNAGLVIGLTLTALILIGGNMTRYLTTLNEASAPQF